MKKSVNFTFAILTVFIFGFLVWNSSENSISYSKKIDFSKEVNSTIEQNNFYFNSEGLQNETFSFNSGQNQTSSNQIVRKLTYPFFYQISLAQIELFYKNSFEVLFDKKNLLDLFFTTSIIIFPFHYFW
ncbi:hypothetical protein [Flavobacterium sp.]|uniref:hypothetical protein n=1 Tax=Flavobacterium sp. TaxID=239 RepID=UPI002A7F37BB|nr:hypothetical protein [Flavobacterium sp.]